MFVHFAPNTLQDKEGDDLSTPLSAINPDIDTDNWAQCAVNLGARYIVFVAKHAGGFCMWQTETTPYSIGHTPWKDGTGDVLADLSASCRKHGLGLGVYFSPRDDYFGANVGGVCKDAQRQPAYNAMYRNNSLKCSRAMGNGGGLVRWFECRAHFRPGAQICRPCSHLSGARRYDPLGGQRNGFCAYPLWDTESEADARSGVSTSMHGDPDGAAWIPVECDVSIRRPDWFWSTTNDRNLMTLDQLMEVYYRSVGRGAQLLLNIPADRRGLMPDADFARASEFGDEIRRRFGKSVRETAGHGERIELRLDSPAQLDHVILQEDIRYGQRIRAFRLEGRTGQGWLPLYTGSSIGYKRILPIAPDTYRALRLVATDSLGEPHIRRIAVFNTAVLPPVTWDAAPEVWAADTLAHWKDYKFEVDMSKKITDATQYRLRFVPQEGKDFAIRDVQLLLDGIPEPNLIRSDPTDSATLLLNMPGVGQKVVLSGTVSGTPRGTILLQKM